METKTKEFLLQGEDYFLVVEALKTLYDVLWDSEEDYAEKMINELDELLTRMHKNE